MVSIRRTSITDLSFFERQRCKAKNKCSEKQNTTLYSKESSPWTDDASSVSPPLLEALFNRNTSHVKRVYFNCDEENCMIAYAQNL